MKRILNLTTGIFCLFISSCTAQLNVLDVTTFEKGINSNDSVQILDVRTPDEYNSGHIKNALLANWNDKSEFERRISFLDKTKPVYVYCLAGGRSAAAAKKLIAIGCEKVYDLDGGINAWKSANKPLEGKNNNKQMTVEEFSAAVNSFETVLVDFGAEWCPPCRKMEPVLKNLEAKNKGKFKLIKVDAGKDEVVLKAYNVTALPVFIIFKNGKQVWRKDGVADESEIVRNF